MEQVSRKSDHNSPNVRSRCILANLYKAKKHLDPRPGGGGGGEEKNKRDRKTIQLYLHPRTELEDEHLFIFYVISS